MQSFRLRTRRAEPAHGGLGIGHCEPIERKRPPFGKACPLPKPSWTTNCFDLFTSLYQAGLDPSQGREGIMRRPRLS